MAVCLPEGWDVTTESVVSVIVAGMSARTSFFILMVASSVSFGFSDFSTVLSTPLSSPIYLFLSSPPPEILCRSSFIRGPVLRSLPFFVLALLIPVTAASSSCSCRLDSFLLSWRERLNSLRLLFAPDSLSSFLGASVSP